MKLPVPFYKMVASGNDFVVVDNRQKIIRDPIAFTRKVCRQHQGAGADGVLLFESSKTANFKMRIINLDGSEAAACGNGFRCIALYAYQVLKYSSRMTFESGSGLIEAEVGSKDIVKVQLVKPRIFEKTGELVVQKTPLQFMFLDTGVPHVVIFTDELEKVHVAEVGRLVRNHAHFQPFGTNVNFVEVTGKKDISVRTYERGVEDETLACGTGSTASAVASVLRGFVQAPVQVQTRSGEKLKIDMQQAEGEITKVFLEGQASFVYKGEYLL